MNVNNGNNIDGFGMNDASNVLRIGSGSRQNSFNRKNYKKMDSLESNASSNAESALDFLADMCVGIDEIETSIQSPLSFGAIRKQASFNNNRSRDSFDDPSKAAALKRDDDVGEYFPEDLMPAVNKTTILDPIPVLSVHNPSFNNSKPSIPVPIAATAAENAGPKYIELNMKLLLAGGTLHLAPMRQEDLDKLLLLSQAQQFGSTKLVVTVDNENSQNNKPAKPVANKAINPKHIYRTSCDTYRVQMSKGSKTNPNCKFSRNTRTEVDALWLCEFALMLNDKPMSLDDILLNGNFKCMVQRGMVTSQQDFFFKLYAQFFELERRSLLKPAECEIIRPILQVLFHPYFQEHQYVQLQGAAAPQQNGRRETDEYSQHQQQHQQQRSVGLTPQGSYRNVLAAGQSSHQSQPAVLNRPSVVNQVPQQQPPPIITEWPKYSLPEFGVNDQMSIASSITNSHLSHRSKGSSSPDKDKKRRRHQNQLSELTSRYVLQKENSRSKIMFAEGDAKPEGELSPSSRMNVASAPLNQSQQQPYFTL